MKSHSFLEHIFQSFKTIKRQSTTDESVCFRKWITPQDILLFVRIFTENINSKLNLV